MKEGHLPFEATHSGYKFKLAFARIHDRGEVPTPTKLNAELGRTPSRNINGRETALRRELMEAYGYTQPGKTPAVGTTYSNRWRRPDVRP